jgi:lipid-A-disaccharide synthase
MASMRASSATPWRTTCRCNRTAPPPGGRWTCRPTRRCWPCCPAAGWVKSSGSRHPSWKRRSASRARYRNPACREQLETLLADPQLAVPNLHLLDGHARTALYAADVVLLASGTATLETMLAKRPMVVGYKVAPMTYRIVKALGLLKVERYALPNVLAGEDLAPELMQDECTPDKLADAVLHWFRAPQEAAALQPKYLHLHEQLRQDASARAADAVSELLEPAAAPAGIR